MKEKKSLLISLFCISFILFSGFGYNDKGYAKAPVQVNRTELLRLVNQARKSGYTCNDVYYPPVKEVIWNNQLEAAAKNHCLDMYKHDFFAHQSSNGGTIVGRLKQVQYAWLTFGENLALGYKTEEEAVSSWLKSPDHCEIIMCAEFTEMGVATSDIYWTQVFAKPNKQ